MTISNAVFTDTPQMAFIEAAFRERLTELELALENQNWVRIWEGDTNGEFSRDGIRRITELARILYLKNPLIRRAVTIQSYYVFGRGVNIAAKDDNINLVIQRFIDDANNQLMLTSPQARKECDKTLRIDGNLFFALFVQPDTGGVRVGTIPLDDIQEIIRDPNNRRINQYYKRIWSHEEIDLATGETKTVRSERYYADIRLAQPASRIGDIAVDQEARIYHVKTGGLADWAFGISETYAAQDWARAYKSFLEDWAKVIKALARFAWRKRVSGGAAGVRNMRAKLQSTFASTQGETNPSPTAGGYSIEGSADEALDPIKTANSTTSAGEGKEIRMMIGSAMGLPDHILSGDADQGNRATATTLDRPTEFAFVDRQELWQGIYQTLLGYVLFNAVKAPSGLLRASGDIVVNEYGESVISWNESVDATITVDFPSILEKDQLQAMQALVLAAPYITDTKVLLTRMLTILNFQDVDELVDAILANPSVEKQSGPPTDPQIQQ